MPAGCDAAGVLMSVLDENVRRALAQKNAYLIPPKRVGLARLLYGSTTPPFRTKRVAGN